MKKVFITFGDEKYRATRERLRDEARSLGIFDEAHAFGPDNLDAGFLAKHGDFIRRSARGYGYWIWKPQIIHQTLSSLADGDLLMYADAGCQFNPAKKGRLAEYFRMAAEHPTGILTFHFPDIPNGAFTKMDTALAMDAARHLDAPMHMATILSIKRCDASNRLVSEWKQYSELHHLLDDTPSRAPNAAGFRDHRHDQSIFSLLCCKYAVATLGDESGGGQAIQASRLGPRAGFWQKLRRSVLIRRSRLRW